MVRRGGMGEMCSLLLLVAQEEEAKQKPAPQIDSNEESLQDGLDKVQYFKHLK